RPPAIDGRTEGLGGFRRPLEAAREDILCAARDIRGSITFVRQTHRRAAEAAPLAIRRGEPRSPRMIRAAPRGWMPGLPAPDGVAVLWHRCRDGPAIAPAIAPAIDMGAARQHSPSTQMQRCPEQRPGTRRRGRHKLAPFANGAMALLPADPLCLC